MADFGIFIGWGNVVRGREMKSLEVFNEALQFWERKRQSGEVENVTVSFLAPHGGDLNGFLLIRGEQEKLLAIYASEEFQTLNLRANLIVDNFGALLCTMDGEVQRQAGIFAQAASQLV